MEKKKSVLKDIVEILIGTAIISFILLNFVLQPCKVNGISMMPNLHDGDFGYSFIITKKLGLKRFDTVVIKTDLNETDRLIVKRVIGLPNETVEFKNNKLYIDGQYYEEAFIDSSVVTKDFSAKLSEDEYYCLGDNRSISRDSRYYGPFKKDDILASHLLVVWPFKNFGVH